MEPDTSTEQDKLTSAKLQDKVAKRGRPSGGGGRLGRAFQRTKLAREANLEAKAGLCSSNDTIVQHDMSGSIDKDHGAHDDIDAVNDEDYILYDDEDELVIVYEGCRHAACGRKST